MTNVKFKIIESKGFSVHELPAQEALDYIKTYIQKNDSWFYINGNVTKIEKVTADMLQQASMVTITNIIGGGGVDAIQQDSNIPKGIGCLSYLRQRGLWF